MGPADFARLGLAADDALRLDGALRLARALLQQVAMSGTPANDVGWVAANLGAALRIEFALAGEALAAVEGALRGALDEVAALLPETRWDD
ncbi:MAG: hypothetical protein HY691_11560 [Chloroflexi bacterium]|nr:hypothetical protein [Chloroflexota bacterium]